MALVTNSRLSVQPVTPAQWKRVCKMAGIDPDRDTPAYFMSDLLNDLWLPPAARSFAGNAVEPEQTRGFVISDPHSTKHLDLIIWHTPDGFRVL